MANTDTLSFRVSSETYRITKFFYPQDLSAVMRRVWEKHLNSLTTTTPLSVTDMAQQHGLDSNATRKAPGVLS
jgi:hypothetical protein